MGIMTLDPLALLATVPTEAADAAAKTDFLTLLYVLMLATFTGLLVIRNVSRLLHTPLMSLTNAISAIAVVGSIVLAGNNESTFTTVLGAIAVTASMTNIVSGFLLTDRMLKMFKKREPAK
jgi:NAD(P) transhydrogenase subunit alpha